MKHLMNNEGALGASGINYPELFESFKDLRVLVIGDLMIDSYFYGKVERISPEAPVPVVQVEKKESRVGGAGNVALNLKSMGAEPYLFAVTGDDREGDLLRSLLEAEDLRDEGVLADSERITTVKTRIIGNNHHVLRVDSEQSHPLRNEIRTALLEAVKSKLEDADAVIFEDYNKGVIDAVLIEEVVEAARERGIPVIVDPKKENFHSYKGVTLYKPNRKEVAEGLKIELDLSQKEHVLAAARQLIDTLQCEQVMITLSEDGVLICSRDDYHFIPAHARKIVDVSGAGDTVVAVAALCVALQTPMKVTAELSNLAGGLVCENLGVVPIDADVLLSETFHLK